MSFLEELVKTFDEKPELHKLTVLTSLACFSFPCHFYFYLFDNSFFQTTDFLKLQALGAGLSLTLWIIFLIPILWIFLKKLTWAFIVFNLADVLSLIAFLNSLLFLVITLIPLVGYWILSKFDKYPSQVWLYGFWGFMLIMLLASGMEDDKKNK